MKKLYQFFRKKEKKILHVFQITILLAGAVSLGYILLANVNIVKAWTEPSGPYPAGDFAAPVNVSLQSQAKAGKLTLGDAATVPPHELLLKTPTGSNAELNIQSGNLSYWGLYHDQASGDFRFWNNDAPGSKNVMTLDNNTGNVQVLGQLCDMNGCIGGGSLWTESGGNIYRATGNVGIGTTNPASKLHVAGAVRADAFYYSSDESLKANIVPLTGSLEKIAKLRGVSYAWKENKPDTQEIGLIAQEVEKIFPELVYADKGTGLKSVAYGNLVAPLIEAVKEQQKEIETLRTTINEQKWRIDSLERKIEILSR